MRLDGTTLRITRTARLGTVTLENDAAILSASSENTDAVDGPDSGTCGDNIQWVYDSSTDTLTISGYGDMDDFSAGQWPGLNRYPGSISYSIDTVIVRDNITSIGNYAFQNCAMDTIVLPDSIQRIGDYAFQNCSHLTEIVLPDSVTTVGNYAFMGCSNLTSITLSDNITTISSSAFNGCSSLSSLSVPDGATSFSIDGTPRLTLDLSQCRNLETLNVGTIANRTLDIPDCVKTVIVNRNNTTLTTVNLGSGVESTQLYGSAINNVTVDSTNPNITVVDDVIYSKDMTRLMDYPMGKTDTSFTVPDGVNYVERIENDRLTSLTFGKDVTEVRPGSILCDNLQVLNVPNDLKSVSTDLPSDIAVVPMDYHTEDFIPQGVLMKYYSQYINAVTATPLDDGSYRIHVEFSDNVDYSGIRVGSQYNLGDIVTSSINDFILPADASDFMTVYLFLDTGVDEVPPTEWEDTSDDPDTGDFLRGAAALILFIVIVLIVFGGSVVYIVFIR